MTTTFDRAMALLQAGQDLDQDDIDAILQGPLPARPRAVLPPARLLDLVLRLAGLGANAGEVLAQLLAEAQRRGMCLPAASARGPLAPPADGAGIWLSPEQADVQHGQVWVIRTTGNGLGWGQIDGYDVRRGKKHWRAISLATRRTVQVKKVLDGSCPRLGGKRERAKR